MKRNGHDSYPPEDYRKKWRAPDPKVEAPKLDEFREGYEPMSDRSMTLLKWVIGFLVAAIALLVVALFLKPFRS